MATVLRKDANILIRLREKMEVQSELPRIDLSSPKNYAIEPTSLDLVSHLLNVARVSISFFAAVSAGGQRVPAARMWVRS